MESTLEEATALFENVNEDTIRKLKQLKITLTVQIEVIKDLDSDIVEITEDEDDVRMGIQESALFKRKEYEILFDILKRRPNLNVIMKFSYSRDLLEGTATAGIASLQTSKVNYGEALEKLHEDSEIIKS